MNTQTFAQTQDFKAINDDELIAVNDGGIGGIVTTAFKIFGGGNHFLSNTHSHTNLLQGETL